MKPVYKKIGLFSLIILIVVLPVVLMPNLDFGGSDDKALGIVTQLDANYTPWFDGVKIVKSSELTTTFFALQAALGASVIAYYIGFINGKKQKMKDDFGPTCIKK